MLKSHRLAFVVGLLVAASTAGAASPSPAAHKPYGTIQYATSDLGKEEFLPNRVAGAEATIMALMYDLLVTRAPGAGGYVGGLATGWTMAPDGKTWTFKLRKGVQFQGGWGEFTSADVKTSFELIARKDSQSCATSIKDNLARVDAPDPYTAVIHLKTPDGLLDKNLANLPCMPLIASSKYIAAVGEKQANQKPIGTGAWQMTNHVFGDRIEFQAVENHWRQTPYFKTLILKKVPEPTTRMAQLQTGQADIIDISLDAIKEVKQRGLRVVTVPSGVWTAVTLGGQFYTPEHKDKYNPSVPWAQPDAEKARKVRLAMNYAVDKDTLSKNILGGYLQPAGALAFYPEDPVTDPSWKPIPYDPNKAKQLLAEAGYPNGFQTTMLVFPWPGRGFAADVAEGVATYLERVGITVKREKVERAVAVKLRQQRQNAGKMFVYPLTNYAESWMVLIPVSTSWGPVGGDFVEHPELDALIKQIQTTLDHKERERIMRTKLAPWLMQFMPAIQIGPAPLIAGVSNQVGDWPMASWPMINNLEYLKHR